MTSILDLIPIGKVVVSHEGYLQEKGIINLTLKNEGEFRIPTFCISWSANLKNIDMPELNQVNKPKRLEYTDKCFSKFDSFLRENGNINRTYQISYDSIFPPTELDYLKIYIIDGDVIPSRHNLNAEYKDILATETDSGEDLGAEDILYEIQN